MEKFVKNKPEYDKIEFNENDVKKAYDKLKKTAKHPTSVNLLMPFMIF